MWYDAAAPAWQLRIEWIGAPQPVWRRIVVPSTMGLDDLGFVLQRAVGWVRAYLAEYRMADGTRYDFDDAYRTVLQDVTRIGDRFGFHFDSGQAHEVVVERVAEEADRAQLPRCLEGDGTCPDAQHPFTPDLFNTLFRAVRPVSGPGWAALGRLKRTDGDVSPADRVAIVELGADAVPDLIEVIRRGPPRGTLATRLLSEIGLPEALEPVREALTTFDVHEAHFLEAAQAVGALGSGLAGPLLDDLESAWEEVEDDPTDTHYLDTLYEVLVLTGARDSRILSNLERLLRRDPVLAAAHMHAHGDPAALPLLAAALDRTSGEETFEVIEFANAIVELGGTLTPAQQSKQKAAVARQQQHFEARARPMSSRRFLPAAPVEERARPGRNDPCWCGSGKKYKKCHLAADRARDLDDGAGPDELGAR